MKKPPPDAARTEPPARPRAEKRAHGRPRKAADDLKSQRHLVRMTLQDEADFLEECERLSMITGQQWGIGAYLLMAGKAMKGKHLA